MRGDESPSGLGDGLVDTSTGDSFVASSSGVLSSSDPIEDEIVEEHAHDIDEWAEESEEEVLDEKPKSLILEIIKQLRPNMDLSRITLPTFVLEPRSLLEKLTDFLSLPHLLVEASQQVDPLDRLVGIVKWYLSGFHYRPKGVKKPYNPILGEVFECEYDLGNGIKMRYLAEQVSHHPPISAFYCECRKMNIVLNGFYYPRSRFFGNSAGSIGEGLCHLYLLEHGERYEITWPNVYVKGIFLGKLRMELGGEVTIRCEESGYFCEMEFKNRGFFTGENNSIAAKIKESRGKKRKIYKISGRWDRMLELKNELSGEKSEFLDCTTRARHKKLVRKFDRQCPNESRRVWEKLTEALKNRDQKAAGDCKFEVEEEQRTLRRSREERGEVWQPRYFTLAGDNMWMYNDINLRPYDPSEDMLDSSTSSSSGEL